MREIQQIGGLKMFDSGENQKEVIRPDFNRAIMIDFQGAKITSDVGLLLMREIDDRFKIIAPMGDCLEDLRSPAHTKHSLVQMIRQRIFQAPVMKIATMLIFCGLIRPSGCSGQGSSGWGWPVHAVPAGE